MALRDLISPKTYPISTPGTKLTAPDPVVVEDDVAPLEKSLSAGRTTLDQLRSDQTRMGGETANLTLQIARDTANLVSYRNEQEVFKAQQKATESKQLETNIKKMLDDERNSPQYKEKERINKELAELGSFVPTEVTAPMLGVLFSAIGATGMLLGGNSKNTAKAALSAMNGMAEGFAKGREQYDKERKAAFDTNVKLLQTKLSAIKDGLEDARREAILDKEAADIKVRHTLASNEAQFLQENTNKRGLESTIALVDGQLKNLNRAIQFQTTKATQLAGQLDAKEIQLAMRRIEADRRQAEAIASREFRAQEAQKNREFREQQSESDRTLRALISQGQLSSQAQGRAVQLQIAQMRQEKPAAGEKLSATREKKIDGLNSITSGLDKLKKDFKPEYAGLGVFGFGADLELEAARRGLGKKEANDAARWWGRYNQYQAPNRHALFGATLTGNELKNYQSFTAKPSDSAETVRGFIDDQINYSKDILDVTAPAGYKPRAKPEDYESTFGAPSPAPQPVQNQQPSIRDAADAIISGKR
jgi:hypothetical protein